MDGSLLDVGQLSHVARRTEFENRIRARARAVPLAGDRILCRILGRYKFYVDAQDIGFGAHIALDGYWEFWITQFIIRHLAPDTLVMDIGANHGYYTMVMADLVGPAGKVISIEPFPRTRELLESNVSINGFSDRTTIDGRAIADVTGRRMPMVFPANEMKNAHIEWGASGGGAAVAETVALDDMDLANVDFMKVDIDGSEERMWRGMQRFLDRNRAVRLLLEFNRGRCEDARRMLAEIAERYALRHVDTRSEAVPVGIDEIMSAPPVDWMLYLSQRDPLPDRAPPSEPPPPAETADTGGPFRGALPALGLGASGRR